MRLSILCEMHCACNMLPCTFRQIDSTCFLGRLYHNRQRLPLWCLSIQTCVMLLLAMGSPGLCLPWLHSCVGANLASSIGWNSWTSSVWRLGSQAVMRVQACIKSTVHSAHQYCDSCAIKARCHHCNLEAQCNSRCKLAFYMMKLHASPWFQHDNCRRLLTYMLLGKLPGMLSLLPPSVPLLDVAVWFAVPVAGS